MGLGVNITVCLYTQVMPKPVSSLVRELRAVAEPTRLRMLAVLSRGEFSVGELTEILDQSQPRVSRHLKLLGDSGLLERFREQHWIYYRVPADGGIASWVRELLAAIAADDPLVAADRDRVDRVLAARRRSADGSQGLPDEAAIDEELAPRLATELGENVVGNLLYLGSSPARLLGLLAPRTRRVVGVHPSRAVLQEARAHLHTLGLSHCVLQHADLAAASQPPASADLVIVDRVLATAPAPARLLREAARAVSPAGRLVLIEDFDRLDAAHAGANPLLLLRSWIAELGWSCRRLRPVEAGSAHLLIAFAQPEPALAAA
jgi:ArsR family transcriptional regulator